MRGPVRNIDNARLLHSNGGTVFCGHCGCVTGRIEEMNYKYIKYFFVCKCESEKSGKVELYRGKRPWLTHPHRPIYNINNQFICQNCETPLFWLKEDAVDNYALNVICKCGVEYDLKFERTEE